MLMAVLEGRALNRRSLRPIEVAASHLAAAAAEDVFSSRVVSVGLKVMFPSYRLIATTGHHATEPPQKLSI